MTNTVLNYFKQPDLTGDNVLVLGGDVEIGGFTGWKNQVLVVPVGNLSAPQLFRMSPGNACTVVKLSASNNLPITSETSITFEIGGSPVADSTLTFPDAALLGTVIQSVPTGNNVLLADGSIEIITDGAAGSNAFGHVTIEIAYQ